MTNDTTTVTPTIPNIVTIRQAVRRAQQEQLAISEYSLRRWIKEDLIPVRHAGTRVLLYYPHLVDFLHCGYLN